MGGLVCVHVDEWVCTDQLHLSLPAGLLCQFCCCCAGPCVIDSSPNPGPKSWPVWA